MKTQAELERQMALQLTEMCLHPTYKILVAEISELFEFLRRQKVRFAHCCTNLSLNWKYTNYIYVNFRYKPFSANVSQLMKTDLEPDRQSNPRIVQTACTED